MAIYRVVWRIALEAEVIGCNSEQDAIDNICNCDPQEDGEYVTDSFEILKVEEVKTPSMKP
jgi:hypothetical protein